jgi:hypothetical protein
MRVDDDAATPSTPKRVYLDQLHWIGLTKARQGESGGEQLLGTRR